MTAAKFGEVVYISKCSPVFVQIRRVETCYQELPITYLNRSYFMTSKNHLIQTHGEEITCNNIFPPMFKIMGQWYQIIKGNPIQIYAPHQLTPTLNLQWTFQSTKSLADTGIYSQHDLDKLRDHIMYGTERQAITSILTRGFMGENPDHQGGDISNRMSENTLENLGTKITAKIWGGFITFGSFMSGVLGVIVFVRIIKWCLDTLIHGKALYELYGCSVFIIGAIWDSLTLFLLHRKHKQYNATSTDDIEHQSSLNKNPEIGIPQQSNPSEFTCIGTYSE